MVKILLEFGADLEVTSACSEDTPLITSISFQKDEIAEYLLSQGAKSEVSNKFGETPLTYASRNGNVSLVEDLISRGANVNSMSEGGRSPLWLASFHGHDEVVKSLLTAGANTSLKTDNCNNSDKSAPLHVAVLKGNFEVVTILLDSGANIDDTRGCFNDTALLIAVLVEKPEIAKYLVDQA